MIVSAHTMLSGLNFVGDRDNCFLPTRRLHLKKCLKGRCYQQS